MPNQVIKINFQTLESKNPQFLLVADLSVWEYAENLPAFLFITLPGSSTPLQFSWKKNAINSFNSHNFGLSCFTSCGEQDYKDTPDGIYTITLKSGYEDIEKTSYYLKTDRFENELSKVIIKNGFEYDPKDKSFRDNIFQIKWMLLTAQSHAHQGDFVEANINFEEAKKLLKTYVDCKDCL
jgi:hypothetical protein